MSQAQRRSDRAVYVWTAVIGGALVAALAASERGAGPLTTGAGVGVCASFLMLALRVRSVRKAIYAESKGEAARSAFAMSLGKLGAAFAAMSVGAIWGAPGAVGALLGVLTSNFAVVGDGLYSATQGK